MTPPAVAVDAGQTEVRAVLVEEHGPVAPGDGGGAAPSGAVATAVGVERIDGAAVDADAVAATLLAAISRLDPPVVAQATVAVGLSGFEAARPEDLERVAVVLRSELKAGSVVLASDGVTSLLGALGDRPGAVVAAGTGTIVVARGREGWARVDGWGSLLGDAGSGFAIGRAGLDAALRELDGRGGSPALLLAAIERFDVPTGDLLVEAVHRSGVPTRAVAGFAEVVGALAGEGEATCVRILADAGHELALSAATALDRALADDEPATVSYTGNVFKAGQPLLEPFAAALAEHRPAAQVVTPVADGLAGAAALARNPGALPAHPGLLWRAA